MDIESWFVFTYFVYLKQFWQLTCFSAFWRMLSERCLCIEPRLINRYIELSLVSRWLAKLYPFPLLPVTDVFDVELNNYFFVSLCSCFFRLRSHGVKWINFMTTPNEPSNLLIDCKNWKLLDWKLLHVAYSDFDNFTLPDLVIISFWHALLIIVL